MWYEDKSNFPCWVIFEVLYSEAPNNAEYITHYISHTDSLKPGLYNGKIWVANMEETEYTKLLITLPELAEHYPERLV